MLTDWMAARVIQVGWIQKLDASNVPNLHDNIIDSLAAPAWDKNRDFSAPWQSGLTGIAYNKKKVKEVKSFQELLTRPDLNGRVSLLTEMRDTMGFALLAVGADPGKFTDADWQKAIESMRKAKSDGQVRAFTGNDYVQDLSAGNILAAEAWSGDIANAGDDNLVWIPPEEGVMIWADNMLVPNLATHKINAEKWINYYYDPIPAPTALALAGVAGLGSDSGAAVPAPRSGCHPPPRAFARATRLRANWVSASAWAS